MRPQNIGRALGIGVRIAGRIAGQRLAGQAHAGSATQAAQTTAVTGSVNDNRAQSRAVGQAAGAVAGQVANRAGQAGRNVSRGVGGFLRPFRRVGGILWLEVMGVFFLLPVVVFAPNLWRYRASYAHGPDHRTFVVSAFVVLVFLYLGVSSFWRAQRRSNDANH